MKKLNHCFGRSLAFVLFLFVESVVSNNYQVGSGKSYTRIQEVTSRLKSGDTVFVDGNAEYTGDVQFTAAGTAAKPIVVKGIRIDGKRPVISGGTNTVHFKQSHHLVFEGFEVTGGSSRGIFHQADSVIVRDVAVHDCPQQGILGADIGSGTLILEYSEVYRCGSGSSKHQIYMTTDEVNFPGSVFRMQYCYIHDATGGNNVKSRSERNEIYYNWIEGAYYHELELIGPDPGGVDDGWTIGLKREDSDVVGNVLFKRKTAAGNDSNFSVTRCGGDATGWSRGRYRFVNNTIVAGTGAVFRLFDTLESIEMHNNIFYGYSGGVNIIRAAVGEMAWATGKAIIAGSNNWVMNGSTNIPGEWTGTIKGSNPGFVDFKKRNLFPDAASPCVNTGNEVCTSPSGYPFSNPLLKPAGVPPAAQPQQSNAHYARVVNGGIDIGAYEFTSGAVIARPVKKAAAIPVEVRYQTGGNLEIVFTDAVTGDVELRLFEMTGKLIERTKFTSTGSRTHSMVWNSAGLGKLPSGSCLLEIRIHGAVNGRCTVTAIVKPKNRSR